MATIQEALYELGIKEWVIMGEPTNETEFKSMFPCNTKVRFFRT